MLSLEQQAHVLSLHDAVVEIKATLNNGLKTTVLGPQGRAKSRQKNDQSIRDALRRSALADGQPQPDSPVLSLRAEKTEPASRSSI